MRFYVLLVALLSPLANAGILSTEHVQAFPSDWPKLAGMSAICSEVQGSFVDPNTWRWEHEEIPGSKYGAKSGGIREGAWIAFGLSVPDVRPEDQKAKSRAFTISIEPDQSLTVRYLIDGVVATSRSFTKTNWHCDTEGLRLLLPIFQVSFTTSFRTKVAQLPEQQFTDFMNTSTLG